MSLKRFISAFIARNREFMRDRTAVSWNIVMPVLIVMGFAFAFTSNNSDLFKVGFYGAAEQTTPQQQQFLATQHILFIEISNLESAVTKLERHQLDMILDLTTSRYWTNQTSPEGYILERMLGDNSGLEKQSVSGDAIRYVDWLAPGVFGMNIMFASLFGVGYSIVRYRKNGVLKRLRATPLTALEFLTAQVASRLWLILLVTVLVYTSTNYIVGFRMYGSYLDLFLVLVAGTLCLISLGLIIAARMSSEEAANGLLNLITLPMMILSGVWFSLEGSSPIVQKFAQLLPLTHFNDAARAIMLDGASLLDVSGNLLTLIGMTLVCMLAAAYTFRWE
ncbi:MAG: ABC transporter permease [Gammaproteobacteria bacterium]|nr:ABC transporter permease [Gammaproteobacteria bacterium]